MSRRRNKEQLLEKILKSEANLLQEKKEDYFHTYYGSTNTDEKEESDNGVSDYRSDDEEEEEDIFDDDFDLKESESEKEDNEDLSKDIKRKKNLIIIKNKKDRYFKKGFDINNLNFESLEYNVKEKKKSIKKKKKQYIPVAERSHYIHEIMGQRELLKNAMLVERFNIFQFLENERLCADDRVFEEINDFKQNDKNAFRKKKKIFWDEEKKKVASIIEFGNENECRDYFLVKERNFNKPKDNRVENIKEFETKREIKEKRSLEEDKMLLDALEYMTDCLEKKKKKKKKNTQKKESDKTI